MKNYILTLGLILPTVLFGQIDRSIRPEAAPAPTINIKNSEVFTTANGITVILSENHRLPRVSFNLSMGATPKVEGDKAGLSGVAGSLILSGTENRSKDELDNAIDYMGASLIASSTNVSMSCLTKHMDKGLGLMSDVVMNANFPQSEVDRIISQNEDNLLATKSQEAEMSGNARAVANFPSTHPYGEVMTQASLDKIDRASIVQYFKRTFTPNGSYLVVVGDITLEQTKVAVEKNFGSWSGGAVYKAELVSANSAKGNRVIFVNKAGADQSVISITYPLDIKPSNEDYLKLKVLDGILGGGVFGNRLMQNLREDKGYTYGCRSRARVDNYGSTFSAGGNFRNDVTDSAIVEILMELDRITEGLVEDEELSMTKSSMAGSFARSLEQPSTVARFALNIIRNELPKDYYQTYLKQLEAVTKEDVLMVAQKYMTGSNCNIVVVGNEEVIDRITKFDSDGKIEKLDAFGNEASEKMEADISADQLLEKYSTMMAMGSVGKALKKKLKSVKTHKTIIEMKIPQAPGPALSTTIWTAKGAEGSKMEMMGMTIQKSHFDGKQGGSGGQGGAKIMTEEEIVEKKKSYGLIPEMNYAESGMDYELTGIEIYDGKPCYVLKLTESKKVTFEYFDKETFQKTASVIMAETEIGMQEVTYTYADYKEYGGFLFPDTINLFVSGMQLSGKVKSREVNVKVDLNEFK